MELLLVVLAIFGIASQLPPAPPDVADCHLSHSFVLGKTADHPGAIEIWACERNTVVTLTQFTGPWNEHQSKFRNSMRLEVPQDQLVVGCKNEYWVYDGIVAETPDAKRAQPSITRAWQADLDKWKFEEAAPRDVICNRDFGLD